MLRSSVYTIAVLVAGLTLPSASRAESVLQSGHADFGAAWEDDAFFMHVHAHEGSVVDGATVQSDTEFALSDIRVLVPEAAKATRPNGAFWDFIGVGAGQDYYLLPSITEPDMPFFGIGAELPSNTFVGNQISFRLTGMSGPGDFSFFYYDPFQGDNVVQIKTIDGIDPAQDYYTVIDPPGHDHRNWAFSAPGIYDVTFQVEGQLLPALGGGTVSQQGTLRFEVVPEPSTLALAMTAAFGVVAVAAARRRRA